MPYQNELKSDGIDLKAACYAESPAEMGCGSGIALPGLQTGGASPYPADMGSPAVVLGAQNKPEFANVRDVELK
jgi:hypothetical protein